MSAPAATIAISGAGPAGLTLALLLLRHGIAARDIVLFDAKSAAAAARDARVIALSYGSRQILQQAGCWPVPATPISEIHVSRRGHFGRTLIAAREHDVEALGYVAQYGAIVAPLQAAAEQAGLQMRRPCRVEAVQENADGVTLQLDDGSTLQAGVLVQAEGGTFAGQAARARHRDYEQTALIADIRCSAPLAGRAFERFTEQGPLALLPHGQGYALVWCVAPDTAQALLQLDDAAFCAALQDAFGGRLGKIVASSPRHAFPLGLNAHADTTAHCVPIGNAAQTLHPVAGQGLNLALRDAAVLAALLAQHNLSPAGYVTARSTDRAATIAITDRLARLFAGPSSPAQSLLGAGLGLLDLCAPARQLLAQQMMFGWR